MFLYLSTPLRGGVSVISWACYLYCGCLAQEGESLVYLTKHFYINPLYQWFSHIYLCCYYITVILLPRGSIRSMRSMFFNAWDPQVENCCFNESDLAPSALDNLYPVGRGTLRKDSAGDRLTPGFWRDPQ